MKGIGNNLPLADIHLPPAVPAFPWAPGWWLVLAIGVAGIAVVIWSWHRRRRRLAYRRDALKELDTLRDCDDHQLAQALNQLLRRVALQCHPHDQVAGLSGEPWLRFLTDPDQPGALPYSAAQRLLEAAYRPDSELANRAQLIKDVALWIRKHRRATDV